MPGDIKTINLNGINMREVNSTDDLIAIIHAAPQSDQFVLFKLQQRESLFKIMHTQDGKMTLRHYDLKGLPMILDMKTELQKHFPTLKIDDICREERMAALNSPQGFGANQNIPVGFELQHAIGKLDQPIKLGLAAGGFFGRHAVHEPVAPVNGPVVNKPQRS